MYVNVQNEANNKGVIARLNLLYIRIPMNTHKFVVIYMFTHEYNGDMPIYDYVPVNIVIEVCHHMISSERRGDNSIDNNELLIGDYRIYSITFINIHVN
jgi:hypothetical protein